MLFGDTERSSGEDRRISCAIRRSPFFSEPPIVPLPLKLVWQAIRLIQQYETPRHEREGSCVAKGAAIERGAIKKLLHLGRDCIALRGQKLNPLLNGFVGSITSIVRSKRLGRGPERGHRERAKWRIQLLVNLRQGREASALLHGGWTRRALQDLGYKATVVNVVIL